MSPDATYSLGKEFLNDFDRLKTDHGIEFVETNRETFKDMPKELLWFPKRFVYGRMSIGHHEYGYTMYESPVSVELCVKGIVHETLADKALESVLDRIEEALKPYKLPEEPAASTHVKRYPEPSCCLAFPISACVSAGIAMAYLEGWTRIVATGIIGGLIITLLFYIPVHYWSLYKKAMANDLGWLMTTKGYQWLQTDAGKQWAEKTNYRERKPWVHVKRIELTEEDLQSICDVVCSAQKRPERILRITDADSREEADVEVSCGEQTGPLCGHGFVYYVSKRPDGWTVTRENQWKS